MFVVQFPVMTTSTLPLDDVLDALTFGNVGVVDALFVSPRPDEHVPAQRLALVPGVGVEGEYPGKQWWRGARVPGRQISAVSADVLDALDIDPVVVGDNLVIRGLDLRVLLPGDCLRIGDALLRVTPTPHRPCTKLAARTTLAKMQAIQRGGWRGVLLDAVHECAVTVGAPVERILW